jgi:hypothetical protein
MILVVSHELSVLRKTKILLTTEDRRLMTATRMLESKAVRHRPRATHSRQPRQVRKEATVTSSCVCSGCPVPGFFLAWSLTGLTHYTTKVKSWLEKFGRLGKMAGKSAVGTPNQFARVPAY